MEAILLVGGLGTRLHPLTLTTAKPMLPLGNTPITEHQLRRAASIGIKRVVLSTSYLSDSFLTYFEDGSRWGLQLIYAIEDEPLGTAGAIRHAASYLESDAPVFIFNGDVISHHSLTKQMELHTEREADVTLHLLPVNDVRAYGRVSITSDLRITEFVEKPQSEIAVEGLVNAGCYIFNPQVIEDIPEGRPLSVEREVFPKLLLQDLTLVGHLEDSYWLDLGTPTRYLKANLDLLTNNQSQIGEATISNPELIEHSVIGFNVIIEANVSISNSLILDGVNIGENSHISHTILGNNVNVHPNTRLEGVVAGDNLTLSGQTFPQSDSIGAIATSEL